MKHFRYKSLAITLLMVGVFSSCNTLEENPKGFLATTNFYKTAADANAAVTAVYYFLNAGGTTVQTPYNSLFSTGMEMMTDDIDPGPGATNPDVRSQAALGQNSSGLRILQIWQQHYAGIYKANLAIDLIPGTQATPAQQAQLIAEAKALRALFYFNLVRLYGDVPLLTVGSLTFDYNSYLVKRTPAAQVYAQIIQDLKDAIAVLPANQTGANVGRVSGGAAKSLLSKVYLTQYDWANALTEANAVINGGYGYSLLPNYPDVFNVNKKNSAEHIFSAQFLSLIQAQSNVNATRGCATGVPGIAASYADQVRYYTVGSDKFFSIYKLYKKSDKRLSSDAAGNGAFTKVYISPTNGKKYAFFNATTTVNGVAIRDTTAYLNKYWDANNPTNLAQSAANVPIIRYSDVLLIAAEADNELNGGPSGAAYNNINIIRNRAGLPNLTPGLTQDQFRDSVYFERRLELVWEWHRWFDLIREYKGATGADHTGQPYLISALKAVGKTNVQQKHYLFPIPLQELQLNPNLTQNPGW